MADVRQPGAAAAFTSLHQVPYGADWLPVAIRHRKAEVEAAGLRWTVVESIPVHEGIKTGRRRRRPRRAAGRDALLGRLDFDVRLHDAHRYSGVDVLAVLN